jgi:hypothetical protein
VKLIGEYCDATQAKALWNKALEEPFHFDSWKIPRFQMRDVEVVNAFRVISEKFGDPPASVLNKSNKSNLAFRFDLNLIREVEI